MVSAGNNRETYAMNPIRKIVIVGGGTSGWMAAAILSHHLKQSVCRIQLVESADIGTIGIGESTIPPFVGLIRRLGIDEQDFMRATQSTYKLGIRFVDWRQRNERYFHPFGVIGKRIGSHDFYQCWLRARQAGDTSSLSEFSPCAVMAENGRFFRPGEALNTPIGGAGYAFHVDATLVAQYLRRYAEERGVERLEGKVVAAQQRDNGFLDAVLLDDGRKLEGDFFIDCTGFRGELITKILGVGYEDWSEFLPCDRAVAAKTSSISPIPPYTRATARRAGWMWNIPLQHRVGQGYVYSSAFCSDQEARSTLLRHVEGEVLEELKMIRFTSGRRKEIWRNNCLALGLAAGFIEPLESTAIHLIARGVDFFLRYFPDRDCDAALVREYNRRISADYEEVRDFIVLHYCATEREDTEFWRWCRNMSLPDSLRERIELFEGHGALREGTDELFRSSSWQSVFEGMGIRPRKHCPRVNNLELEQISTTLRMAKQAIRGMVNNLPTHEEFIRSQCQSME
ncbi:tryptophan halogenase family protein [Saccharophagus sp. K07]|jgi:tryptophan halogenase|uniref:tryptophan halogenase family protein n=1 Tax=Saccharophagus sp. K07 TaxID=2283636 RepID=UPI00210393E1|nr:tryptophan halogenase family protein [Saccharophagus sp. K07]